MIVLDTHGVDWPLACYFTPVMPMLYIEYLIDPYRRQNER